MSGEPRELGPGITAQMGDDGRMEVHVDLPTFARALKLPESEAEALIERAARQALETVFGRDQADKIPIETVRDLL